MRSGNGEGPRLPGAARSERPVLRTEWRTCVMSCDKFREQIPECLAGRLDAAVREKLIAHVDTCAVCRSDLAEIGVVWRGLASLPVEEPAPRSSRRVRAAGPFVLHRQGLVGAAAAGSEGVLSRPPSIPVAA